MPHRATALVTFRSADTVLVVVNTIVAAKVIA